MTFDMSSRQTLREALASTSFICVPGIHDMITALVCNKVGFDFVYASGYWTTASAHGLPDAGIASYTQMLDRVATLAKISTAGVIADADTGYGGLLNLHHTVLGFEAVGAVGIQIEDQEFPKKCGHTRNKRVISIEDMVAKVKVACEARNNLDTLIIARTDARHPEGYEAAIKRGIVYGEAGADIVFVEALETKAEMHEACVRIKTPMMANMADGGRTPILDAETLKDIGYSMAIFPAMTGLAAAAAAESALIGLKTTGTSIQPNVPLYDFSEFNKLIGFPEIWDFEKKWAIETHD